MIKNYYTYIKDDVNNLKSLINDIIDSNIKRSESYGLIIKKDDEELERNTIYDVFFKYYDDIKINGWKNYEKLQRKIIEEVYTILDEQIQYYFHNTPERETRTRYQIHLEYVISETFRSLVN